MDHVPAARSIVTPVHLNDYPRWSQEIQDAWDREHSPADQEHEDLRIPIAAGIIEMSAGTYSVGASKHVASVSKTGTGDITITFGIDGENATDYGVIATPILAAEPFIVKEYDDGATRNATGCVTRLLICDQTRTAKDCALYVRLFGRRAAASTGTGVAVNDVRQRIAVDGPESAEHRRLLREFTLYWTSALAQKHGFSKYGFGAHFDLMVPRAVALLRPPANPIVNDGPGEVVWQKGFSRVKWEQTFGLPAGGLTLPHQVAFTIDKEFAFNPAREMWHGGSMMVTQDAATLRSDACVMPRLKRSARGFDHASATSMGMFELGDAAGGWDSTQGIVAIMAYRTDRSP
jgi:hypothetical protein